MTSQRSAQLQAALHCGQLVKFTRPFEEGSVNGYVVALGPQWFSLALVSDGIRFNGFQCFRLRDVRRLEVPHPHARFVSMALKKRGERRPRKPRVSVASVEAILRSVNRRFHLVTIHRERVDPECCWIGRVLDVDNRRVTLLEIAPGAVWEEKPRGYRLSEITRVDFGGDYEDALFTVGGNPPEEGDNGVRNHFP